MASDQTHNATTWKAITAGSSAIEPTPAAIYVGGAGDVTAEDVGGNSATFTATAGAVLPIQPVKITAATATGLVALYNT